MSNKIEVATQIDDGTILMPDGSVVGQDGKTIEQTKAEQKEIEKPLPPPPGSPAAQAKTAGAATTAKK